MSDHDQDGDILLQHHPPEQLSGACHRALGCNVGATHPEPINKVGIQVFVLLLGCSCART